MSDIKLLLCPFCGGEAYTYTATNVENGVKGKCWLVHCKKCGLNYPHSIKCYIESEAIEQWNTRKPMERIAERVHDITKVYLDARNPEESAYVVRKMDVINILKEEGGIE